MPDSNPSLLFVCIENSCRSQIAEGFARREAGDGVAVHSAGSKPSGIVNERAVAFMAERGIDITTQRSKGLDELPALQWDYLVTMGCGDACPHLPARQRLDWDLPDPKSMDDSGFRDVRDRIERLVYELLQTVSR
jgi:protein-tyrosine-phosphatase